MIVIKHGDPEKVKKVLEARSLHFACKKCGCEFTAESNECLYLPLISHASGYFAFCPDCKSECEA